jgi:hypothetical protein
MKRYLFIIVLVSACYPTFESGSIIKDLRILAIKAEPPEPGPGDKITLSSLIADPKGKGFTPYWFICDPGRYYPKGCAWMEEDGFLLGRTKIVSGRLPKSPTEYLLKQRGGRPFFLYITLVALGKEKAEAAIKRVVVSLNKVRNHNPKIKKLLVDGEEFPAQGKKKIPPKKRVRLTPVMMSATREPYFEKTIEQKYLPRVERFFYSWFATGGKISSSMTQDPSPSVLWQTPEFEFPEKQIKIYLIVRDGRGGVDFREYIFIIC